MVDSVGVQHLEGFPNAVIQAGAMGRAVVDDINGCNEIVLPDLNGVIIPSKDEQALYESMKYFASHPVEVERMAANARPLIASRYEQRIVWNALLDEYKSII
ncbi:MAG: glycosyltransferase [Parabacteroides merdae]